jgi:hypothetical protein
MKIITKSAAALFFLAYSLPVNAKALPQEYMNVSISGGSNPIIDIDTNLPEGMQISVDVQPAQGGFSDGRNFIVKNHHVHAGPFSAPDGEMPPNEYLYLITSPAAQFQDNESVQRQLGENGQNLAGPDVKESELGIGRVIDKKGTFRIP